MKNKTLMLVLLFLMPGTLMAQQPAPAVRPHTPSVTSLTSKDLPEFPGKEVLMITVDYPPGSRGSHPPAQCTCVRLCVGGLDNHAGERWKGSDADTGPDFL